MYKIFKVMGIFSLLFLLYFGFRTYEINEGLDKLSEFELVSAAELNTLTVTTYPNEENDFIEDFDEVQSIYEAIKSLEIEKVERPEISESYVKLYFQDKGTRTFVEYYLYDNGYIVRNENSVDDFRTLYYKMDDKEFQPLIERLLAGKALE